MKSNGNKWGLLLYVNATETESLKATEESSGSSIIVETPHNYTDNTVYISDNINFGKSDTGSYLISFTSDTQSESGTDFLKVYEGRVDGKLLYQRSGYYCWLYNCTYRWPNVLVIYIYFYIKFTHVLKYFILFVG